MWGLVISVPNIQWNVILRRSSTNDWKSCTILNVKMAMQFLLLTFNFGIINRNWMKCKFAESVCRSQHKSFEVYCGSSITYDENVIHGIPIQRQIFKILKIWGRFKSGFLQFISPWWSNCDGFAFKISLYCTSTAYEK